MATTSAPIGAKIAKIIGALLIRYNHATTIADVRSEAIEVQKRAGDVIRPTMMPATPTAGRIFPVMMMMVAFCFNL